MIVFGLYSGFVFICGLAIGSTILRDWLDTWPAPKPKRPTIPLDRVLHDAQWRRLDVPTFKRRQAMPIIDVTGGVK